MIKRRNRGRLKSGLWGMARECGWVFPNVFVILEESIVRMITNRSLQDDKVSETSCFELTRCRGQHRTSEHCK